MTELKKVDRGLMYAAVRDQRNSLAGLPYDIGYINRHTGEIVFVAENSREYQSLTGVPALEMVAARAAIEARPSDWVEIPRMTTCGDEGTDQFIDEFLQKHGFEGV